MALNQKQSKYMYEQLDTIYKKYYPLIPFSQDTWDSFMDECKALDNKCKGNKYNEVRDMIFAMMEYVDKLHAKGYKEVDE